MYNKFESSSTSCKFIIYHLLIINSRIHTHRKGGKDQGGGKTAGNRGALTPTYTILFEHRPLKLKGCHFVTLDIKNT